MKIGKDTSGNNEPLWFNDLERASYPSLDKNISAEICIIGAGISGLTLAYKLVCEGKSVVVIEDGRVASGESGRTSAHLSNILDDRYAEIVRVHGREVAHLAAQSHAAAINFIEETVNKENIECEFSRVEGYLFLDENSSPNILEKEFDITSQLDLHPEMLSHSPLNTFNMGPSILFPRQAQFHPLKYLEKLAEIIVSKGGKIFENTHFTKFEPGKPVKIYTSTHAIVTADILVLATNVPVYGKSAMYAKQEARRTYVLGSLIPKNSLKPALYWDTANPYHYVRIHSGNYAYHNQACDVLITGGEDHRTGKPPHSYEECFNRLEKWTKEFFPQTLNIIQRWSGQIIEPHDYLGFLGHSFSDGDNVFIATGDSGNGLTHGTIAGILISDLIIKHNNKWEEIYKPSRKTFSTWQNLLRINLTAFLTYSTYLTPGDTTSVENISPGEGAVIRRGLKKVAVYKDESGKVFECSAVCPHMKSIIQWNSTEKTWDCPAHGARYTGKGEVINGPANRDLEKLESNSK